MRVYFPYDDATLSRNYMTNASVFAEIDEILATGSIPSLEIISFSSPEGNWDYNLRLSRRRANSLKNYLERHYPVLQGNITINPDAEAWGELKNLISNDTRLSDSTRKAIIDIIDSDRTPDVKERMLKGMDGYKKLYRHFFRGLRYAQISVVGEGQIKVAASGTDAEGSADDDIATNPSADSSAVSENGEDSVYNAETADDASNDNAAVSGSAATASVTGENTTKAAPGIPVVYFLYSEDFIRPDYKNNEANLAEIARMIKAGEITDFTIAGFSSPEGSVKANENLSYRRAVALKNYLVNMFPELEDKLVIANGGENWSAFREQVENGHALSESEKQQVLSIIDSNDDPQTKEARLKRTDAYRTIIRKYFPNIRSASFVTSDNANSGNAGSNVDNGDNSGDVITEPVDTTATTAPVDTTDITAPVDTTAITAPVDTTATQPADSTFTQPVDTTLTGGEGDSTFGKTKKTYYEPQRMILALKTNLLYDVVSALNFEIEVPIGKHFSVMVEDVFPWWETGNKYCFEMWEIGVEPRYWFKGWDVNSSEKLRGFFVGPYAMSSKYDFQYDTKINYQGEYWSAGISGGYAMPLATLFNRFDLNMEFNLAVGFMHSDYRHYFPADDYSVLIRDRNNVGKVSYFGPTKAKVSLVLTLPSRKKGVRYE